jgi:hypothetical protein
MVLAMRNSGDSCRMDLRASALQAFHIMELLFQHT